jgi:Ni/Co efflux regulator RcnB
VESTGGKKVNFKRIFCVALALTVASANIVFAQGKGEHKDRGEKGGEKGGEKRAAPRGGNERHDLARRAPAAWANNRHEVPREYRHWNKGDRLPREYWDRQYVVDDWRGHHLRQPPRGYHWVQSGSDYLLVAIATGIIADLLLNR